MTEANIRKLAKEWCEKNNWLYWFPVRTRFHREDIFTIGDMLVWRGKILKIIQLTTLSHKSERIKKIQTFLNQYKVSAPIEVWAWDKKKKLFVMTKI